jgi:hypothetical protein
MDLIRQVVARNCTGVIAQVPFFYLWPMRNVGQHRNEM